MQSCLQVVFRFPYQAKPAQVLETKVPTAEAQVLVETKVSTEALQDIYAEVHVQDVAKALETQVPTAEAQGSLEIKFPFPYQAQPAQATS